jgi:hypothetical protein
VSFLQRLCQVITGHLLVADGYLRIDGETIAVGHCGVCRYKP